MEKRSEKRLLILSALLFLASLLDYTLVLATLPSL
jgi:hypothetical protein